eukprot:10559482-Alexandrium_andersonii.AAC.1
MAARPRSPSRAAAPARQRPGHPPPGAPGLPCQAPPSWRPPWSPDPWPSPRAGLRSARRGCPPRPTRSEAAPAPGTT